MLKINYVKPERLVAVLRHDQPSNAVPGWFVSRTEAQYLLDTSLAFWKARWTIVLKKPTPLKVRDASCSIKEHTIIEAIGGSKHHRSLIEAWAR